MHKSLEHDVNRIANLFHFGIASRGMRDVLLGYHGIWALCQLYKSNGTTKREFLELLDRLGYPAASTKRLYEQFFQLNLLHEEPGPEHTGTGKASSSIVIHDRPVEAYALLATRPEYLIAIAQVTPIDEDAFDRMKAIDASTSDPFLSESLKCMAFIEFIRRAELEFAKIVALGPHDFPIPILWKRMASNYFDRLTRLRKSGLLSSVGHSDWIAILSSPLFRELSHH
jgi:hypothetical protein